MKMMMKTSASQLWSSSLVLDLAIHPPSQPGERHHQEGVVNHHQDGEVNHDEDGEVNGGEDGEVFHDEDGEVNGGLNGDDEDGQGEDERPTEHIDHMHPKI